MAETTIIFRFVRGALSLIWARCRVIRRCDVAVSGARSPGSARGPRYGGGTEAGRGGPGSSSSFSAASTSSWPRTRSAGARVRGGSTRGGHPPREGPRSRALRQQVSPVPQGSACLGRQAAMPRIFAQGKGFPSSYTQTCQLSLCSPQYSWTANDQVT